jgi:hypothetical protein
MSAPGVGPSSVGPSEVWELIATRYREILPSSFVVEADRSMLSVTTPSGAMVITGPPTLVLRVPLLPVRYRLEQFAKSYFGQLPEQVAQVARVVPEVTWPAIGTTCHIKATNNEVRIWYGHTDNEEEAVLKVQPILRSELGI